MIIEKTTIDGTPISKLKNGSEKRVKAICDTCGKSLELVWHNYNESQKRRNFDKQTICRICTVKKNGSKNKGKPSWNKGLIKNNKDRKLNPYISRDGYKMIHNKTEEINSKIKWNHYIKEHIFIIEQFLGRKMQKGEVIHHIDMDKLNNNIENLYVTNDKDHMSLHLTSIELIKELIKKDLVFFDKKEKKYKFTKDMKDFINEI